MQTYIDKENPRLLRSEAEATLRRNGYVRMDGHTATDMVQLDRLYEVIFPAMDAGTYSQPADYAQALTAARKADAESILPRAASDGSAAALAQMQAEIDSLKARLDTPAEGEPATPAVTDAEPPASDPPAEAPKAKSVKG